MATLDTYGKIIREYNGKGFADLNTGQCYKCSVFAVQLSDGKVMASCHFPENINLVLLWIYSENSLAKVKGVMKDGEEFLLEGHLLCTDYNFQISNGEDTIDIVFIADSLKLTKTQSESAKSVRFGITNFKYLGNKVTEYPNGGGALDTLSVNLDNKTIEIQEIQGHKSIMKLVEAQKGIDVTSEAVVNISSITDLDMIIPLIDTLCKLLSLARGTKINWIYYDCYDASGEKILSSHKSNVVWQYAGLPLIDHRNPYDTASFINQSFSAYLSHKDDLDKAIETYLDAKRETGYLELRALRAVVVLEFLKSRYTARKGIDLILQNRQFKNVRTSIKSVLTEQFKAMSLSEHTLNEMESRIGELNRPSFKAILETMFAELGIGITKDELDRFIKIRNSLVHKASFVTEEYWNEYTFLVGILDRIFLKILNYDGYFLDITNKSKRIDTTNHRLK